MKETSIDNLLKKNKFLEKRNKELEISLLEKVNSLIPVSLDQMYHTLFRLSPHSIIVSRVKDGTIFDASDYFFQTTGFSREEAIGKTTVELNLWLDHDREKIVEILSRKKRFENLEVKHRMKDGTIKTCLDSGEMIKIGDEQYLISIETDITERKNAEMEREAALDLLGKSEKYFKEITENSSDIIIITEKNGDIKYCSRSITRFTGYKPEELIGRSGFSVIHPDDLERAVVDYGKAILIKESTIPNSFRIVCKDGSERCFEGVGKNLLDNPDVAGFVMNVRDITERKQAEDKLRFEQQWFQSLIEHSSDIIVVIDPKATVTYVNKALEQVLGYKPEERIGEKAHELIHPDDINLLAESFISLISDTNPLVIHWEMRLRHKNGNWRLLEAVGSNLVNNNVVEAVIVNYRDITERKQKEEALQKSEERLRLVAERTNDLIYERDLVTGIATFFGEMDALHGYEPGGFPCSIEGFIEHLHPDDVIKAGEALLLANEQNRPYEVIHRLRRKDGSYVTWWDRATLIKDERGFPLKLIGAATDITKLKEAQEERDQAETALKASESKYRLLADNISDVIFVLDMNLNYTYVSPSVKILRGYEQEEVMKQSALEMLTPSSADLATRTMSEIMELEKSGQREINDTYRTLQLEMKRKDGTTMWTEVKMSFIRDDNQQPIAILGLTRDITERKRYETELKNFAENLEDTNIALRVLMNKRNEDQKDFEEKLQVNINDLVIPYLTRLNKKDLDDRSKNYLSVLESNLSNILSPFMRDFRSSQKNLTPQEIQIVDLIMKGKNTKEIADMLNASVNTVATHRNNIRKKLNLRKSKINLRSYLLSLK